MLLHQYDSETGQYLHSFLADADPKSDDRWLEPAFTTAAALPDRARREWPFFKAGAWVLLPDYRATMLYRQDSGEAAEILVAGIAPADAGLTETPRPSDMHRWANGAWELDQEALARQEREKAMAEFDRRMAVARANNSGKADAYAADLLSPVEAAIFKAWAAYQMDLVRVVDGLDFPAVRAWPAMPDPLAIGAAVEADAAAKVRLAEYDARLAEADAAIADRTEAHAAGQLDAVQLAVFNAWTVYRQQLANLSTAPSFPAGVTWPALPDEAAIETAVTAGAGGV